MEPFIIYIISQIFFVLNYIFLLLTYHVQNRKKIFIFNTISLISEAIWFLLLWARSGWYMLIFAFFRNIIVWYCNKKSNSVRNISFIILCFTILIISALTYNGIYSILPWIAWIIYLYSLHQKNTNTYKILWIPVELCWILYNVCIQSIMWIVWDTCILTYIIYNLYTLKHKK